jgi:hypothetical protein
VCGTNGEDGRHEMPDTSPGVGPNNKPDKMQGSQLRQRGPDWPGAIDVRQDRLRYRCICMI